MDRSQEKLKTAIQYAMANRPKVGGFPFLAECLRKAGVKRNIWSLPSTQSIYIMEEGAVVNIGKALISEMGKVPIFDKEKLSAAIQADQNGETTFPQFLEASWLAGVIGYDIDFTKRTCHYFGINGENLQTSYSALEVEGLNF